MNELVRHNVNGLLASPYINFSIHRQALGEYGSTEGRVKSSNLHAIVKNALSLPLETRKRMGKASRHMYLTGFHDFFNRSYILGRNNFLAPSPYALISHFPFDPKEPPPESAHRNPDFSKGLVSWFRGSHTSFKESDRTSPGLADKWVLHWPDSISPHLAATMTPLSGRIISRSWSNGSTILRGVEFRGDGCMKILSQTAVPPTKSTAPVFNLKLGLTFTSFGASGVIYRHSGGSLMQGLSVVVLDHVLYLSLLQPDWNVGCALGAIELGRVERLIFQFDGLNRRISVQWNEVNLSNRCWNEGWEELSRVFVHWDMSVGGSIGCLLSGVAIQVPNLDSLRRKLLAGGEGKRNEWRIIRAGDHSFKGIVFDVYMYFF
jgi:hypothetical protein